MPCGYLPCTFSNDWIRTANSIDVQQSIEQHSATDAAAVIMCLRWALLPAGSLR